LLGWGALAAARVTAPSLLKKAFPNPRDALTTNEELRSFAGVGSPSGGAGNRVVAFSFHSSCGQFLGHDLRPIKLQEGSCDPHHSKNVFLS